ncbi:hypothetical protein [Laspinema olomoucense]|uniref:hypothetical protein n=1 Tax=Laspinema olomoucense TaxID=3231600 RepID=UPI0021BB5871|nr:hypothetical protein [Laspinema sp. D3c]MCT7992420.1 hypothetical protein [Laspinema sp. D3c]
MSKTLNYFQSIDSLTESDLLKLNFIASCSAFKSVNSSVCFGDTVKELFGYQFRLEGLPEISRKDWVFQPIWWVELNSTDWLDLSNWGYQKLKE